MTPARQLPALGSKDQVTAHVRAADEHWEAVIRSFDPYSVRLRDLAVAAIEQSRALQFTELSNGRWKAREDGLSLGRQLMPGADRPGTPALWAEFDDCQRQLDSAARGDQIRQVWSAYEQLAAAAEAVADGLADDENGGQEIRQTV